MDIKYLSSDISRDAPKDVDLVLYTLSKLSTGYMVRYKCSSCGVLDTSMFVCEKCKNIDYSYIDTTCNFYLCKTCNCTVSTHGYMYKTQVPSISVSISVSVPVDKPKKRCRDSQDIYEMSKRIKLCI